MKAFIYLAVILASYAVGSSNMALYISKLRGVDMRAGGSGNLGASNALILMGWGCGVAVGLHDILKAAAAVYLAQRLFPALPAIGACAGAAAVLGHIFPFYLRFKGGKGLASFLGMTAALNWKLALSLALLIVLITLITDYIVIGTVTAAISVPLFYAVYESALIVAAVLSVCSIVILFKHRENYGRIIAGTEIGLRGAHRGEHRQE